MNDKAFKAAVATVCAYETVAIVTGRVPTVTCAVHRYPLLGLVVLAGLSHHFWARVSDPEV